MTTLSTLPLVFGAYEGDKDACEGEGYACDAKIEKDSMLTFWCTRSENHKGLCVAGGLGNTIYARWVRHEE